MFQWLGGLLKFFWIFRKFIMGSKQNMGQTSTELTCRIRPRYHSESCFTTSKGHCHLGILGKQIYGPYFKQRSTNNFTSTKLKPAICSKNSTCPEHPICICFFPDTQVSIPYRVSRSNYKFRSMARSLI